jgi:hypothetical protein
MIVAPYHTDEFVPTLTSPKIVAFGATKDVFYRSGSFPSYASFLRLGVMRSSLRPSPSRLLPISYRRLPVLRITGAINF